MNSVLITNNDINIQDLFEGKDRVAVISDAFWTLYTHVHKLNRNEEKFIHEIIANAITLVANNAIKRACERDAPHDINVIVIADDIHIQDLFEGPDNVLVTDAFLALYVYTAGFSRDEEQLLHGIIGDSIAMSVNRAIERARGRHK
jgi:hypothetical protein